MEAIPKLRLGYIQSPLPESASWSVLRSCLCQCSGKCGAQDWTWASSMQSCPQPTQLSLWPWLSSWKESRGWCHQAFLQDLSDHPCLSWWPVILKIISQPGFFTLVIRTLGKSSPLFFGVGTGIAESCFLLLLTSWLRDHHSLFASRPAC